ncbi:hypothetical protein TVAG_029070 [Trichomonas vaginalis G3]|uniref:DNA-3-methyladenine glycosylase I n=1 Tax=Trichomonas vaginalis (strain ATCC PRA-98 / G3) TaxID=412133 RepID=A2F4Z9_TRIV3|nr:methyladenine glycosylase family [Trichomonas vaginalis G3]EAY00003.1 hypothetical protein TVAG_029070 [Trichomonas vaginalis G3]KAI5523506.1 methyladenine glycosylase family [Trichomonas vaginalis G3]|eukprot:XP_001312932.1 hypothetical protein [Trichomonas vaginalis G3]
MNSSNSRCDWANSDPLLQDYHDNEWCIPVHDDNEIFKWLNLEGQSAGLSWLLILKRKEKLCAAYADFDPSIVSKFDDKKVEELMETDGVIKHKLKVKAVISNAQAFLKVKEEFGTFDKYIWQFVNFTPIINKWDSIDDIPSQSEISDKISKDLKKRGFKFVGSTLVYSFMQAIGMVNDHLNSCPYKNHDNKK